MKRAVLLLLLTLGLGASCDRYSENDLELITGYRASALCECLFVMERDEEFCVALSNDNPPVAGYSVDWERREVSSTALMLWGGRARFVGERFGCVLER